MHADPAAAAAPSPFAAAPADPEGGRFVRFPGSPFELFQPYAPAGDQPQAGH